MMLYSPYSHSTNVPALMEVLAVRDARIRELERQVHEFGKKLHLQVGFNARQAEEISELQCRLGLDSTNSSKPPSSDGPAKPPAKQWHFLKVFRPFP